MYLPFTGGMPKKGSDLEGDEYMICGQHVGKLLAGETAHVNCDTRPKSTEVFVYLPRPDVLRMLNVKVFVFIPEDTVDPTDGEQFFISFVIQRY